MSSGSYVENILFLLPSGEGMYSVFQDPQLQLAGRRFDKDTFKNKNPDNQVRLSGFFCDPSGARTQDPNIKSVVLYQLS